ncbi:Rrp15p-domain-containing protein [Infundibulicybe gibba]|nr:Rrp15p-domain-containing protein [Infundibulicybe gibba]
MSTDHDVDQSYTCNLETDPNIQQTSPFAMAKRQKLSPQNGQASEEAEIHSRHSDSASGSEPFFSEGESSSGLDSADEIDGLKRQKSRQTSKRKIRATGSSNFGAALQSLLKTDAPSTLPLSLKPSLARKKNDEKLELRAKRVLQVEKKEKEDKGRITDVIGGWGGESKRALRKVAQRGVVQLFNVIQQAQAHTAVIADEAKAARGSGKPSLPAPAVDGPAKSKGKAKAKESIKGASNSAIDKNNFFDMIRSGGIVSKV